MSDTGPDLMAVHIDYGDGNEDELVVTDGFTSFHPYEEEQKYTVTVTEIVLDLNVASISPDNAVMGADEPDITMTVTGTGFSPESKIFFNGGEENTVRVSSTEMTTIVKPSTAQVAGTYPVSVYRPEDERMSNEVGFTFSETEAEPGPTEGGPTAEIEVDGMDATAVVTYTANTHVRFGWGDGQNGDATTDAQGEAIVSHTYTEPGTYQAFIEDENGTPHNVGDVTVPSDTEAWQADAAFDPAAHTVTEVIGYVEDNPDQKDAILELEQQGKARVTLINHLESM